MPDVDSVATRGGHVFVLHGRIESVVHDAAVVPTSNTFHLRDYWLPLLGETAERKRPDGWPGRGYGRSVDGAPVWFVSVGGARSDGSGILETRLGHVLAEIARSGVAAGEGRVKPLVAVPVIGIEGGGLDAERGSVLKGQLRILHRAARDLDIDIALVSPDRSVYAAAQHLRVAELGQGSWPLSQDEWSEAHRLAESARSGELALFLGAGVSIPAGLPTWTSLIETLSADTGGISGFESSRLSVLDEAQLLQYRVEGLGQRVADLVKQAVLPSLAHVLLASLHCREVVTTNYDRLYETAVAAVDRDTTTILPWQPVEASRPWILKMHGDVENPESIILTRRHFVRFDATTKPAGALLQTLLMTRHLLLVGASLTDDNVIRLAHEVEAYRESHGLRGRFGTLVDVNADLARAELWGGQLHWLSMPGSNIRERARRLEIFLDAVAASASDDVSWLLDERFEALLEPSERELAGQARNLYRALADSDGAWQPLIEQLWRLGAGASHVTGPTGSTRRRSGR